MELHGKALQDFNEWRWENNTHHIEFDLLPEMLKNSLIIEWFYSVGIIIILDFSDVEYKFNYNIYFNPRKDDIYVSFIYDNMKLASNNAIEKANEIYNNH